MGIWVENEWVWKFQWRRRLYEWELEDLERLNLNIEQIRPNGNQKDGVRWKDLDGQCFPIGSIMDKLYESTTPILPQAVSSYIWSIKVPPRAQLTLWLASLEKLKTRDMLMAKGLIDPSQALCPLCNGEVETNSHVLFTCSISWKLWMKVLQWWDVSGVLPNRCVPFMIAWKTLAPRRSRGQVWSLILGCVLWSLWFERNKIIFNNGVPEADYLFHTLKIMVGVWAKELLGTEASHFYVS